MGLEQQLDAFLGAVVSKNAVAAKWLSLGTTDFTAIEAFDDVALPKELRQLWSRFNGMTVPESTLLEFTWLDGIFCYLSVADAAIEYQTALELWDQDQDFEAYWPRAFVPIGTPGDGSRLLVNCLDGSPTYGSVYELFHGLGVSRISASLSRYFETLNACLKEGAISFTGEGEVSLDFDAFALIGKQYNPRCDRFDETCSKAPKAPLSLPQ